MSKTSYNKTFKRPSREALQRVREQQSKSLAQLRSNVSAQTNAKIAELQAQRGGPSAAQVMFPHLKSAEQHRAEERKRETKELALRKRSRAW